jgi:nucleotide-binding universal stress UspA family protein
MRVLVAYDGSASAQQACALVAGLEWPAGSDLVVLSVFQPYPLGTGMPSEILDSATADLILSEERSTAEAVARDGAERSSTPSAAVSSEVGEGRPADAILAASLKQASDLLVVGTRGLGPFQSAVLGSVSAELVDHASCPVLVARGTSIARVILADDGSAAAAAAASLLVDWPIFADSTIRVESVVELHPGLIDRIGSRTHPAREAAQRALEHALEATSVRAHQTAARLRAAGRRVEVDVRQGDPAHAVVQAATDWPADLIVLGGRGHSGLPHFLLGTVGRRVVQHAHCSVLIARASGDGSPMSGTDEVVARSPRSEAGS